MTMIEKVAKAICKAERYHQDSYELYIPAAKAAIEAMQEPTDEMLDAGAYDLDMTLEIQYKNMIDEALKE